MKKMFARIFLATILFLLCGCAEQEQPAPFTPENMLRLAYGKEESLCFEAFDWEIGRDAVLKSERADGSYRLYNLKQSVELQGRKTSEITVEFEKGTLQSAAYSIDFLESEGSGLSQAWDYTGSLWQRLEEDYGDSVYSDYYSSEAPQIDRNASLDEVQKRFLEESHTVDVFRTSENCLAELQLQYVPNQGCRVWLHYHPGLPSRKPLNSKPE